MRKYILYIIAFMLIAFAAYLSFIKIRSLNPEDGGYPLIVKWEGLYHDYNYRDLGQSLNECLGEDLFKTGLVSRAAGWFSGWSCDKVGNPDIIYSLNFDPDKQQRYFCAADEGNRIGIVLNDQVLLNDVEFLENWEDQGLRETTCAYIREISLSVLEGESSLVHCSAGRDRTGAVSALLVAVAAEHIGRLDNRLLESIECDYRRTESLNPTKYGRMETFIGQIMSQGGPEKFLAGQCGIEDDLLDRFSVAFVNTR